MYKIGINVILIIYGGACIFYRCRSKKIYRIPFSEIPINTSSDMVLGCGCSFYPYSLARNICGTFEKVEVGFFLEGGICFSGENSNKMKYQIPEKRWSRYTSWLRVDFGTWGVHLFLSYYSYKKNVTS